MTYDPIDPVTNPSGGKFTVLYKGLDAKDVTLEFLAGKVGTRQLEGLRGVRLVDVDDG